MQPNGFHYVVILSLPLIVSSSIIYVVYVNNTDALWILVSFVDIDCHESHVDGQYSVFSVGSIACTNDIYKIRMWYNCTQSAVAIDIINVTDNTIITQCYWQCLAMCCLLSYYSALFASYICLCPITYNHESSWLLSLLYNICILVSAG